MTYFENDNRGESCFFNKDLSASLMVNLSQAIMYLFLIPLLLGFTLTSASTFTAAFSRAWGESRGQQASFILRNILGLPLFGLGYILAMWQPSTLFFRYNFVTDILGWLLLAVGVMIILAALSALSTRAVSPSVKDTLVSGGLYAYVRHPLYCGVILELLGLVLINPTRVMTLACALGVIWMFVQARLEEIDLRQRIPEYSDYMRRVPGFVPRFWKRWFRGK